MSFFAKHKRIFIISLLGSAMLSPILSSCGSSGGDTIAGIGGTGITSGEITGFGSVFVNGVEFFTSADSQFEIDGISAMENQLEVGMVVRVNGDIDSNGVTGTAVSITYDELIEGPVESAPTPVVGSFDNQMSFSIFGQTVIIDQASTRFKGTDFASLAAGDLIEVSGFVAADSSIRATFIEHKGTAIIGSRVEVRGKVISSDASSLSLAAPLGGLTINISGSTVIDVDSGLSRGKAVEVEGTYQSAALIIATKIKDDDDELGDSDVNEVSLQGIVSGSNPTGTQFQIGSTPVDASNATKSPSNAVIENGVNVEVEGSIVGGILIADEVELREGSVELKATFFGAGPGSGQFQLNYGNGQILIVNSDGQTRFEDYVTGTILLSNLTPGDFVAVKGIDNDGVVTATNVKRRDSDETEIQGSVESSDPGVFITILGITHSVDGLTEYEISETPTTDVTAFFTGLDGETVEITDHAPVDGIADEVSK